MAILSAQRCFRLCLLFLTLSLPGYTLAQSILASDLTGTITACAGSESTAAQTQRFDFSSSGVTGPVVVQAPSGFAISTLPDGTYSPKITFSPVGGAIPSTIIYVRLQSGLNTGLVSGNVTISAAGIGDKLVPVSGRVYSLPVLNTLNDFTAEPGTKTSPVIFSTPEANARFTWFNSNPDIGLPAGGAGNLPAFDPVNNNGDPVSATISVTARSISKAYIPNGFNVVSVVDLETNEITKTIPTGQGPTSVAISPDQKRVYVVNTDSDEISVINTATDEVIATLSAPPTPIQVVASETRFYVLTSNSVRVYSAATNSVLATINISTIAGNIAISPNGQTLYVLHSQGVQVISTATNTSTTGIPITTGATSYPSGIVVSPDNKMVYVSVFGLFGESYVAFIDAQTNSVKSAFTGVDGAEGLTVSPDGRRLYVVNNSSSTVSVINTATGQSITTLDVGSFPKGVSLAPDGRMLYVTSPYDQAVTAVDLVTMERTELDVPLAGDLYGNFLSAGSGCESDVQTFTITVKPALPKIIIADSKGIITACEGAIPQPSQRASFRISATLLRGPVSIQASQGFEIAAGDSDNFATTLSLGGNSTLNETLITIRTLPTVGAGKLSGAISIATTGTATEVPVHAYISAVPVLEPLTNIEYITGTTTSPIKLTGPATLYQWTVDNPAIGLANAGEGFEIPSFVANNGGGENIATATVSVVPVTGAFLYVSKEGSNEIAVINATTRKVTANIPLDFPPADIALSERSQRLFVANAVGNTIAVINTQTLKKERTLSISYGRVNAIAVSINGNIIYAANNYNQVFVLDANTGATIKLVNVTSSTSDMVLSPDGKFLYVAVPTTGVAVVNTETNTVSNFLESYREPMWVALSPDGTVLYVSNAGSKTISVFDTGTLRLVHTIENVGSPFNLLVSRDGSLLFVGDSDDNAVRIIDTENFQQRKVAANILHPFGIAGSADGSSVFVSSFRGDAVVILDSNGEITGEITTEFAPTNSVVTNGLSCAGEPRTFVITIKPTPPTITATHPQGEIVACAGTASTAYVATFQVSGTKIREVIYILAPMNFEVARSSDGTYSASLSLTKAEVGAGPVAIYVRAAATATAGSINGFVELTSEGAEPVRISVTGQVHALPEVEQVPDRLVLGGTSTQLEGFRSLTGPGDFVWENTNPSIGLPASGIGNIPAFVAVNDSDSPIEATITVTPKSGNYAYIANFGSNSVSVVNLDRRKVVATIPVADLPGAIAITPDSKKVYVLQCKADYVTVIDTRSNTVIKVIPVGKFPNGIAVNNAGTRVYVFNELDGTVSIINTESDEVVNTLAGGGHFMKFSRDDYYLYQTADGITWKWKAATMEVVSAVHTGKQDPYSGAIELSPDGRTLYVTSRKEAPIYDPSYPETSYVTVIDAETLTVLANINVWQIKRTQIELSKDGRYLYAINIRGEMYTIDTQTRSIVDTTDVAPYSADFDIIGNELYIVNQFGNLNEPQQQNGTLEFVNKENGTLMERVVVGTSPSGLSHFTTTSPGCVGPAVKFQVVVLPQSTGQSVITYSQPQGRITACAGTPSVEYLHVTVGARNSPAGIILLTTPGFEIAIAGSEDFASSMVLAAEGGNIAETTITIRSAKDAPPGILLGKLFFLHNDGKHPPGDPVNSDGERVELSALIRLAPPRFTDQKLPDAYYGEYYDYRLPYDLRYFMVSSDDEPPGFQVGSEGAIHGLPQAATEVPFTFTIDIDNGYCKSKETVSLVINKQTANVYFNNAEFVYDGQPKQATQAWTTPQNLAYNITYNGSNDLPVTAGTYTVEVSVSDPNYTGSTQGTLVIHKKTAQIGFNEASYTYDGQPKQITDVWTTPKDLQMTIMYSGSANPPVNAGTYTVVASISDPNYSGTSSGRLIISKAEQSMTFVPVGDRNLQDGPFLLSATCSSGLPITFHVISGPASVSAETLTPMGAGTVTVSAIQDGNHNYHPARKDQTFVVSIITGIEPSPKQLQPYPNPATTFLKIPAPANTGDVSIVIVDSYGKLVARHVLQRGGTNTIDVAQLPRGVYNIQLTQNGRNYFYRFVLN